MSDKTLVMVIGLLAGMLVGCMGGAVLIAAGSPSPVAPVAAPPFAPGQAMIEADIAEQYLNRTFLQNAAAYPSPWPVQNGQLDVLPGNRLRFIAQVKSPLGVLMISGTITMIAHDGELQMRIAEVRLGQLPVTGLIRIFQPGLENQINAQANRQLRERTALAKVKLIGVTSDETQLRFFLAGQ